MYIKRRLSVVIVIFFLATTVIIGQEWEWLNPLPTGNIMQSLSFPDSLTGYAVGECGTIIKTTNGGGFPVIIQSEMDINTTNSTLDVGHLQY